MSNSNFLPEGVFDYLPPDAEQMEVLRRRVVDIFHSWGYKIIIPPMMEFLSTLVHEGSADLDKDTFKLIDQISGRLIGIRSDITPQATRIDANFNSGDINRLCYIGSTLTTLPKGADRTRIPIQVGAEIFGADSALADAEIVLLVFELFNNLKIKDYTLELSDSRILSKICRAIEFPEDRIDGLTRALSTKSSGEVESLVRDLISEAQHRDWILSLLELNGQVDEVLKKAKQLLPTEIIAEELAEMEEITQLIGNILPKELLNCDFAESTGYHYYTGISFAVYASGHSKDLVRGGRYRLKTTYSNVTNREAVGFSSDMQTLVRLSRIQALPETKETKIDTNFNKKEKYREIQERRKNGERISYILQ